MKQIKKKLKKFLPEKLVIYYHFICAYIAALLYSFPTRNLTVIGVTGTKGKTTVSNIIWSVLNSGGYKTGMIGTANIRVDNIETINDTHMTMPGPFVMQKLLRKMVNAGCTHVVMEVSSEGLKQYRHIGINYKIAIFTNLSPEHLSSHENSYEKYREAKGKLFNSLSKNNNTISIINADSDDAKYFASFKADTVVTYGIKNGDVRAIDVEEDGNSISFSVGIERYITKLLGKFNVYNILPAIIVGHNFKISYEKIREGILNMSVVQGRMEKINVGQNFTVVVDYAHEQLSINTLLDTAKSWKKSENSNIIAIIGAEGGGRDRSKCEHIGRAAGIKANYVIVTTTDPYDDDPQVLANEVASFAVSAGKELNKSVFVIVDRLEAVRKALNMAQKDDIVLFTGMGAQLSMVVKGENIPWNEREIIKSELEKIVKK